MNLPLRLPNSVTDRVKKTMKHEVEGNKLLIVAMKSEIMKMFGCFGKVEDVVILENREM